MGKVDINIILLQCRLANNRNIFEYKFECLSDMEIMCGPKMSEGDRVLLECIVDKYAPNIKIIKSCLKIQ